MGVETARTEREKSLRADRAGGARGGFVALPVRVLVSALQAPASLCQRRKRIGHDESGYDSGFLWSSGAELTRNFSASGAIPGNGLNRLLVDLDGFGMIGKRSGSEQEFFLTGVMTCLDVMEALEEFRRQVQERCRDTVKSRLNDLSEACGIEWKCLGSA